MLIKSGHKFINIVSITFIRPKIYPLLFTLHSYDKRCVIKKEEVKDDALNYIGPKDEALHYAIKLLCTTLILYTN